MEAEPSARRQAVLGAALLWGLCVLFGLGLIAVRCGEQASVGWTLPAPPLPPLAEEAPQRVAEDGSLEVLARSGHLGAPVREAEALWLPDGLGLVRVDPESGERSQILTPGLARQVLRVGDGMLWVADGQAGVTLVLSGDGLRRGASFPLGAVTSLAPAGERVLATTREGWLLLLEPGPAGAPRVLDRLVLDGAPRRVVVYQSAGETRWAAAMGPPGVALGRVEGSSLRGTGLVETPTWAAGLLWAGEALVWTGPLGEVGTIPPGAPRASLASKVVSMAVARDGAPWFATAGPGVLRGLPPPEEGGSRPDPTRRREGHEAVGIGPDPDGDGVYVTWFDGLVERLDQTGRVLDSWQVGAAGRPVRVADGVVVERTRAGHRLVREGAETVDLEGDPGDLLRDGEGLLLAAGEGGLLSVTASEGVELRTGGAVSAAAAGAAGTIWIARAGQGLLSLGPGGEESSPLPTASTVDYIAAVAVGPRHAFGADGRTGAWVAVEVETGAVLRGWLPGKARDAEMVGDRALVSLAGLGVASLDLSRPERPAQLLRLPLKRVGGTAGVRLCAAPGGAWATMGELGLARIGFGEDGAPRVLRYVDTPGVAVDCTPAEGGGWWVADRLAVLRFWPAPEGLGR